MIFLSTLLLATFITISLIPVFRRLAIKLDAVDIPDKRKVHTGPVQKCGGVAMAIGALTPVFLWIPADCFVRSILMGAGIVVLLGLVDDFRDLGYKTKFAGQVAAALVVIFWGGVKITSLGMLLPHGVLLPDWIAIPLTLLVIVGVTNAINLSDGLDGLAGGISLLSFLCIGYLAYQGGNTIIAVLSIAVVGATFGFLRFNSYPATLFMGDAGSQFLGFLAVTLSLSLTQGNTPLSPLLPLILLGFPVLDTLTVMLERVAEGRPPFVADRNHLHHKLMRLGLFHTEAVLVIYILQAFLITSAFVFRFYSGWFLLLFCVIFSGIILAGFFVAEKKGWRLKRYDLIDEVIKGRLRMLKEKGILIKVSFRFVKLGIPLLLLLTCFLPADIPCHFSISTVALVSLVLVTRFVRRAWTGGVIRLSFYLLIPLVIYLSEADMASWMAGSPERFYNLSFGLIVFFVVLTLKYTRRKNGFKINPTDFLILFIVIIVLILPDEQIKQYHMGMLVAKIMVLFFGYEVIITELRGNLGMPVIVTITALAITGVRGLG